MKGPTLKRYKRHWIGRLDKVMIVAESPHSLLEIMHKLGWIQPCV